MCAAEDDGGEVTVNVAADFVGRCAGGAMLSVGRGAAQAGEDTVQMPRTCVGANVHGMR